MKSEQIKFFVIEWLKSTHSFVKNNLVTHDKILKHQFPRPSANGNEGSN